MTEQKQTLGEVETKHLFNSQLRQKYVCQKLLKSADLSSSYDRKCRKCLFQHIFRLICFPYVVKKHTLGEVGN